MRILLINVPHPAIGSRIPKEQLPPYGLLSIGGPLIDDGHAVSLLDAELGPMTLPAIVAEAERRRPDAVLFGHSGSSSAQPIIAAAARAVRAALPHVRIVSAASTRAISGARSSATSHGSTRSSAARVRRPPAD